MGGLSRHEWGDLHWYAGLGIAGLMIVHLVLNWAWMRKIAATGGAWKLWGGLALGGLIAGLFFLPPVEAEDETGACNGCSAGGGGGSDGGAGRPERKGCGQPAGCKESGACTESDGCQGSAGRGSRDAGGSGGG